MLFRPPPLPFSSGGKTEIRYVRGRRRGVFVEPRLPSVSPLPRDQPPWDHGPMTSVAAGALPSFAMAWKSLGVPPRSWESNQPPTRRTAEERWRICGDSARRPRNRRRCRGDEGGPELVLVLEVFVLGDAEGSHAEEEIVFVWACPCRSRRRRRWCYQRAGSEP